MRVNAVFEGGGVKAIALAGAVAAAEEKGFRFAAVAGTSSGSIVASLLAAGYTGKEMKNIIERTPFSSFVRKTWLHQITWVGPAIRLLVRKGLYSGEALERWIDRILREKGVRTFGDLQPKQLRVIASDISQGRLMVLPDDMVRYGIDPKSFPVAKAIRMSTSIPYFFDPVILRKGRSAVKSGESFASQFVYVVDGGILSNFPLWIFDKEQALSNREPVPTLGFQLVGRSVKESRTITGPISMFQALFATMMDAHDERYIEEHNRFRTIKIPTLGVHTTQFDVTPEKSMELYESGMQAAQKFFDKWSLDTYKASCSKFHMMAV